MQDWKREYENARVPDQYRIKILNEGQSPYRKHGFLCQPQQKNQK